MEFIDLNTGKVYNGDSPYIHWFDGECGVGIMYHKILCLLSDRPFLSLSMKSDIFSLINTNGLESGDYKENINGFEYIDINKISNQQVTSAGVPYNNKFIHRIYISALADNAAEYVDDLYIDGTPIKIGFDAYGARENLYINLSNMGIEIPNVIQKAIYSSNVHEDADDNILLNRKWKELLSNYWDIVANRGSYKSLLNSLEWFEWGDKLRLREFWKYQDSTGRVVYEDRDIKTYINDLYRKEMSRFSKSTYYALYKASQEWDGGELDGEKNPVLKNVVDKWTEEDIMLKMCLLGNFFETYFMPIHLDLIQCTIEDIVFTNNIKIINSSTTQRDDYYINRGYVVSNLDYNNTFSIANAESQVNSKTVFGTKFKAGDTYESVVAVGVDKEITTIENDDDLKIFMTQLFAGVGVLVEIDYNIPLNKNDFVKKEELFLRIDNGEWLKRDEYNIVPEKDGKGNFKFNLICSDEATYDIRMNFITAEGCVYTKQNTFRIVDDTNMSLSIYRIKNKRPTQKDWYGANSNDYNISNFIRNAPSNSSDIIKQYIPAGERGGTGVALNNILILLYEGVEDTKFDEIYSFIHENYFVTHRDLRLDSGRKQYTICVSKKFWFDPSSWIQTMENEYKIPISDNIYRNDYGYFPEFHYVEEVAGKTLADYTVCDTDTICVIPTIGSLNDNPLKYSKVIDRNNVSWEFENVSTGQIIKIDKSIREPYVADYRKKFLDPGYYNVIFKFKLGSQDREIRMNSAFRKV